MPQVVVGAAISAGVGATLTTATFASLFAQNLVLGAISYALQDKPKMSETGLSIGNVREPVSPRKVIYGETRVGGTYLFVDTSEVVWAVLATSSDALPSDHPDYYDTGEGGNVFNATDNPITYGSGVTINGSTYYLATDADGRQCYMTSNTQNYGVIGFYIPRRHNEFFQYVTAIAGHEVEDITEIYFEDEHIATFDASGAAATLESGVTRFDSDGGRQTPFFKSRKGTSTQGAIEEMQDNIPFGSYFNNNAGGYRGWTVNNAQVLVGRNLKYVDGGTQPKDFTDYESVGQAWSSDHQCKDTAIVYGRLAYNPNVYINGLPKVTYRVKGKKLYDPRTSTTVYGNNAALCILDYLMDDKYGLGVSTDEIDMTSFITAANVCDEDVTLAAGGTEKRYTINGVIDTSLTPRDVLENMLTACAGKLVYVNGQFTLYAAEYRTPNVSIDEDDIISSISVSTKNSNRSNYNGVKGSFADPDSEPPFIATEYPVQTSSSFETIDGKQSYTTLDLPFTTSSATAQRLAKLLLNRSRQEITISFKAKLSAINVTAGDTISVTNSRLGFSNKTFEVTSSQLGFDGTSMFVGITATEVSSSTFDWDAEESAIIQNTWTDYRQFTIPAPTDLSVTADVTVQTDGTAVGGVTITWTAALSENITSYELQWKVSTDTNYQSTTTGETSFTANGSFITGATYNVRVRSLTRNGGYSDWTSTTVDIPNDSTAPATPTGLTATGGAGSVTLDWTGNTENDLAGYEVYENSSNDSGTATKIASVSADQFTRGGVSGGVTLYYWVKAYDFSGNVSDFSTGANTTTLSAGVDGEDGLRQTEGYVYYNTAVSSAPSGAGQGTFTWSTGAISGMNAGWQQSPPEMGAGSQGQYYYQRYTVTQSDPSDTTNSIVLGSVTLGHNFEGLVTFSAGDFQLDGSTITTIDGGNISTNTIDFEKLKSGTSFSPDNNYEIVIGQDTAAVGGNDTGLYIRKLAEDRTRSCLMTFNNVDDAAMIWGHGANNPSATYDDCQAVLGTHSTANTATDWHRLGVLGAGFWETGVFGWTANITGGRAGFFERQSGSSWNNRSTQISSVELCNATYAIATDGDCYFEGAAYPFTGAHISLIDKTVTFEAGDIVVDSSIYYKKDVSNVLSIVALSNGTNQAGVLGVAVKSSTPNADTLGILTEKVVTKTSDKYGDVTQAQPISGQDFDVIAKTYDVLAINAIGEGQINVCGENGDIAIGDLIVTSNTAGKGMKQDDDIIRSYTVAKAREAVTFNSASDTAQIACIYLCG